MAETDDQQLARWFDELEATASRFDIEDSRKELFALRESRHEPHALAIAGEALRGEGVSSLIAQLSARLKEQHDVSATSAIESTFTPVLFVETFEFGSLRREVLNTFVLINHRKQPLFLLLVAIPPRPPSAGTAIVREIEARLRTAGINLLELVVCDPEAEGSVERTAQTIATRLQRLRRHEFRSRLLPVTRRLNLALHAAAEATRLDLEGIEARGRQLRFDKELLEARLSRALQAMRAHLESELPQLARPILDQLNDESALLADAALRDPELFGAALQHISARIVESTLSTMLPQIIDRAVSVFSEVAAKETGGAAASFKSAASLTAESLAAAARLDTDEFLTVIRWHAAIANAVGPLINQYPALAVINTVLTAGAKLYLKSTITDAIEQLNEPLRQKLAAIAEGLAHSASGGLRRAYQEPIAAVESALKVALQSRKTAQSAAKPARDFADAVRIVEKTRVNIERWEAR